LALAARLQFAKADYVQFGPVMSFWRENVATGSRMLSPPQDLSLSYDGFGISAYERSRGALLPRPLPAEDFLAYGLWFQHQNCPNPDGRTVAHLSRTDGKFAIRVEDGSELTADRLVVAVGMKYFAFRPPEFAAIPPGFVSHSSDLHDLSNFQGKQVAVVGGGESALECAALLREKNADVEILERSQHLRWNRMYRFEWGPRARFRRFLLDPDVFRRLPGFARARLLRRITHTAAAGDLIARLGSVRFSLGRVVTAARMKGDRVELRLDDQSTRNFDHVVLGTGYRVDINAIPFFACQLRRAVRLHDGYPELNSSMESAVPHLYFTGVAAAWNFGPTMWFVRGAPWTAERISSAVLE
jgi:hypothetical protein